MASGSRSFTRSSQASYPLTSVNAVPRHNASMPAAVDTVATSTPGTEGRYLLKQSDASHIGKSALLAAEAPTSVPYTTLTG